jgi:hypothetical protein
MIYYKAATPLALAARFFFFFFSSFILQLLHIRFHLFVTLSSIYSLEFSLEKLNVVPGGGG